MNLALWLLVQTSKCWDKTWRRPPEFRLIVTRAGLNETVTFASCVICNCNWYWLPYPISSHPRRMCAPSHLRSSHLRSSSYILASASHLRIFISQVFISDLYIFTFTFRSSYFETTSCLHIFGSSSRSRTVLSYHLQDFIMQLFSQFYNLIYVRLQAFRANRRLVIVVRGCSWLWSLKAAKIDLLLAFNICELVRLWLLVLCVQLVFRAYFGILAERILLWAFKRKWPCHYFVFTCAFGDLTGSCRRIDPKNSRWVSRWLSFIIPLWCL